RGLPAARRTGASHHLPAQSCAVSDITFAQPWFLAGLLLLLPAGALWLVARRRSTREATRFSRPGRPRQGLVSTLFLGVAVATLLVAAAQPRWGTTNLPVSRSGSDLMIVLDISRSMDATDVEPSRLAAAKA